jgi:predicted acetyltransferase
LLQLYIHEWSDRVVAPIGPDALYVYRDLERYQDRDAHAAFLFLDEQDHRTIGFALSLRDEGDVWHVEEFFVIAGARKRGVGAAAARRLFATHPGPWTLTVRPENPGGLAFWRRIAPDAREAVETGSDGVARTRLSFLA